MDLLIHIKVYYTKPIPKWLKNNPAGNYLLAKNYGMELVELPNKEYNDLFGGHDGGSSSAPSSLAPPVYGDSLWVCKN